MKKAPTIVLCLPLAYQDGIDQYNGIMRYLSTHPTNWKFVFVREHGQMRADSLFKDRPQGIIASGAMAQRFSKEIIKSATPFVGIDFDALAQFKGRRRCVFINVDSKAIAKAAALYLTRDVCYASYGFVGSGKASDWSKIREQSFAKAFARKKVPFERFVAKRGVVRARKLSVFLTALPKPTAIFADCDRTAIEVLDACHQKGLRIPQEVAVVGVDNERIMCQHSEPTLTSVQPDFEGEGYRAAAAMDALLKGQRTPHKVVCPKSLIIERRTTGAVTSATMLVKKADDLIRSEACQGLKASEVARRLGVSQRLLILRYQQIKGQSIVNAIIQTRIEAVKELLRSTKLPIREIAQATHLGTLAHAQRTFTRHCGITMKAYRLEG